MSVERYECAEANAAQIAEWIKTRGGVLVWKSIDLGDPGASVTTPANNADGSPATKPGWKYANEPARKVTDPAEVDVYTAKEVKRFRVCLKQAEVFRLVLTDGSTNRVRKAVAKAQEKHGTAWYAFDYETQEAVILVEDVKVSLLDWLAAQERKGVNGAA